MTRPPDVPRRRRWMGLVVAVLAVSAVVGVVAGLGGFERRSTRSIAVPAGTELDAGNLVFRFDTATVQYFTERTTGPWEVVVTGTVRNPHDETLAPLSGSYGNLVGIDRRSGQFIEDPTFSLGRLDPERPWGNDRSMVPPVDQWMELRASFRFGAGFRPGDTVELGLVPMEFTASTVLGLNDVQTWGPDSFRQPWTVTLPSTRLPDSDY
ncbi:MAG: hypothetical protein AAGC63_07505 [Propionicimonas sp.]|nr:hypothetical protein [Propionicimonas sp.]